MSLVAETILLLVWLRTVLWTVLGIAFLWHTRRAGCTDGAEPVTAVVPAFNEEQEVAATLAALPEGRVVVVDDGSTDGTAARARGALPSGGQVLRHARNRGKAAALNTGLSVAKTPLVATVDADTRLAHEALELAARCAADEAGVALWLEVEQPDTVMRRMQAQEYVTSLNLERAGQALIGAIAILPGAATLLRRAALAPHPFSARTATEDADLTLSLVREGHGLALAPAAKARTVAPAELKGLLAQRTRWTAGHLACCRLHATGVAASPRAALVIGGFLLSTLAPLLMAGAMLFLAVGEVTPVLRLNWIEAAATTLLLSYAQRAAGLAMMPEGRQGTAVFLLEPLVTGALHLASLALALAGQDGWHESRKFRGQCT